MKRLKQLLVPLVLCLTLFVAALAGCADPGGETEKENVNYTITVTCEDPGVLAGVKAGLYLGGDCKEEKPLTDGKAAFTLPEDTYTVKLSGLPEGCTYTEATVSKGSPSATITVSAKAPVVDPEPEQTVYTVRVAYPNGNPVTGLEVELAPEGGTGAKATLNASGQARFTLDPGAYAVHIDPAQDHFPAGYRFDNEKYTVTEDSPSVSVRLEVDGEPVNSFEAPYLGEWASLRLEQSAPAVTLTVTKDSLLFNGEKTDVYTKDGRIFFAAGQIFYTLSAHDFLEEALFLTVGDELLTLIPKAGLARVEVPTALNGTWRNGEESFQFINSTFSYQGTDGYVVKYETTEGGAKICIVLNEDILPLEYSAASETIVFQTKTFSKTGSGSDGDPYVLKALKGDHNYPLQVLETDTSFGEKNYYYGEIYLSYTTGDADETYTLIVLYDELDLRFQTKAAYEADGDYATYWNPGEADSLYKTFTLTKNTEYIIRVGSNITNSFRKLSPCTASFTIEEGEVKEPARIPIPTKYLGAWYNEADKTETVLITAEDHFIPARVIWNGNRTELVEANETKLSVRLKDVLYTVTLTGSTLKIEGGNSSKTFTLIPPVSPTVNRSFAGLYYNSADKDDVICVSGVEYDEDTGEVISLGSFTWAGKQAELAACENTDVTVVVGDVIWHGVATGSSFTFRSSETGETLTFTKADGRNTFSSDYVGTFQSKDGAYKVEITANSLTLNGKAPKDVWSVDGKTTFCLDGKIYQVTVENSVMTLKVLKTAETVTLTK